jgi:hypothetical protein
MADLEYQLSGPSLKELNETIDKLWAGLKSNPESLRRAAQAKINLARLPSGRRARLIKLRRKGAGLEPASTAIGVAIALGSKILRDVWTHVLLPRLRKQYGDQALKETDKPKKKSPRAKRE